MVTDISKMIKEDGSPIKKPGAAAVGEDGVAKSSNPMVSLTTGCIAGAIECITVWPMEFIKTQLQLQKRVPGVAPPYNGVLSGLAYTVRTTGFLSLYNGLGVTLVGSIPKAGIRFGANAYCKDLLKDKKTGKLNMGQQFLAGMGAGTIEAIFAVTPMETIKTKLIETNKGLVEGVTLIIKTEGFGGLYKGVFATILKQSSNQGLRFMFFNKYKDTLAENGIKMVPMYALIGGMLAGCFSSMGNNPFDVVKTQMQGRGADQYKSTFDCFRQIMINEGPMGFYKGVIPRMGRVVPGQGIIFMSFESIQGWVEDTFFTKK